VQERSSRAGIYHREYELDKRYKYEKYREMKKGDMMNKILWILIGVILVSGGLYTLIPQGFDWWEEFLTLFKGIIGPVLILAGIFCLFIAKMD
jgi:hypothetical protein